MARRVLAGIACVVVVAILGYWIALSFVSHETRIRWLLQGIEDSFNDGSARGIGEALAEDFREAENGLDRRQTMLVFLSFVQRHLDADGDFVYRAHIEPVADDSIHVSAADEIPKATVDVTVRFFERHVRDGVDEERFAGAAEFHAELITEHGHWRITRAEYRWIEGRVPF